MVTFYQVGNSILLATLSTNQNEVCFRDLGLNIGKKKEKRSASTPFQRQAL